MISTSSRQYEPEKMSEYIQILLEENAELRQENQILKDERDPIKIANLYLVNSQRLPETPPVERYISPNLSPSPNPSPNPSPPTVGYQLLGSKIIKSSRSDPLSSKLYRQLATCSEPIPDRSNIGSTKSLFRKTDSSIPCKNHIDGLIFSEKYSNSSEEERIKMKANGDAKIKRFCKEIEKATAFEVFLQDPVAYSLIEMSTNEEYVSEFEEMKKEGKTEYTPKWCKWEHECRFSHTDFTKEQLEELKEKKEKTDCNWRSNNN